MNDCPRRDPAPLLSLRSRRGGRRGDADGATGAAPADRSGRARLDDPRLARGEDLARSCHGLPRALRKGLGRGARGVEDARLVPRTCAGRRSRGRPCCDGRWRGAVLRGSLGVRRPPGGVGRGGVAAVHAVPREGRRRGSHGRRGARRRRPEGSPRGARARGVGGARAAVVGARGADGVGPSTRCPRAGGAWRSGGRRLFAYPALVEAEIVGGARARCRRGPRPTRRRARRAAQAVPDPGSDTTPAKLEQQVPAGVAMSALADAGGAGRPRWEPTDASSPSARSTRPSLLADAGGVPRAYARRVHRAVRRRAEVRLPAVLAEARAAGGRRSAPSFDRARRGAARRSTGKPGAPRRSSLDDVKSPARRTWCATPALFAWATGRERLGAPAALPEGHPECAWSGCPTGRRRIRRSSRRCCRSGTIGCGTGEGLRALRVRRGGPGGVPVAHRGVPGQRLRARAAGGGAGVAAAAGRAVEGDGGAEEGPRSEAPARHAGGAPGASSTRAGQPRLTARRCRSSGAGCCRSGRRPGTPARLRSQNARQKPVSGPVSTHSELGAQSAVGLHAASGGVVLAGRQPMSAMEK